MMWPWVSREAFDVLLAREAQATQALNNANTRYDALLDKYHELALPKPGTHAVMATSVGEIVDLAEPDVPPAEVLAAMQTISPKRDATYDANFAYWERNKERAAEFPKDFAEEILLGVGGTA